MKEQDEKLLTPIQAAHHLGITTELLFQFTKQNFGKTNGLRSLQTVEHNGLTRFSLKELNTFDSLLAGEWCEAGKDRPSIPKAILDHLRAESQNQCARCGSGVGVDTAHISPWAISRSHHPRNLIRICSACHREHDAQHSLSTEQLQAIKDRLIARTRTSLMERMHPSRKHLQPPRTNQDFVGRKKELETLVDALRTGRSATVYGVGGIGKSELLLQALTLSDTGRPVLWCNIEQYRTVTDVLSALRAALATDGTACSENDLPSRLDAAHACVVFDGIEQGSLDDLDEFEDVVNELFHATIDAQFVSTSQILLHRLPAEIRVDLRGLGKVASQALLNQSFSDAGAVIHDSVDELLQFCDGHALTIKLAGALTEHYGSTKAALEATRRRGIQSVRLPGRRKHTRQTSLELCLQIAYEALEDASRQLLWALACAPAGLLTQYIVNGWLEIEDVAEALASLRKWHLVEVTLIDEKLSRTRVLAPIRSFVVERGKETDPKSFEKVSKRLALDFAVMVAVLELKYDTPEDIPYVLIRYGHELPNYLYALELAQDQEGDEGLVTNALSIVQSLMRYFFVLGLPEQGARVMLEATVLAFRTQRLKKASGLAMQFLALAQRSGDKAQLNKGLTIAKKIASFSKDPEVLADVAMCQAIASKENGEPEEAEEYSRQAFEGYRALLLSLKEKSDEDDSLGFIRDELHNNISSALSMLGISLLSQGRYEEAAKAYRHSLQHERGASLAVNRGQTLHQIGNCESYLGNHEVAASLYIEAANIFRFVGMKEYISNAFSELGYALLEVDIPKISDKLDDDLVNEALIDLKRNATRVFDPTRPLNHQQCIGMIRKIFGSVILLSLADYGPKLIDFCVELGNKTLVVIANQIDAGQRDKDEAFPVLMVDIALRLGVLIAQGENEIKTNGDVAHDTIRQILRLVCEAHEWAQDTMRVIDWAAIYFTRRLKFRGITAGRISEFAKNYSDDVVDYLDLVR